MKAVLVLVAALIAFGALIKWIATDWPDTLSGLFFLALIIGWAWITAYRPRYIVHAHHWHHRDRRP